MNLLDSSEHASFDRTDRLEINHKPISKVYYGEEHGEILIPIADLLKNGKLDVFPEITKHDIFEFKFNAKTGLTFRAGRHVGLIPINPNVTIEVKPRVPLKNLERLFTKSGASLGALKGFTRWFDTHEKPFDALLDFLTDALLSSIKTIAHLGLYKEYQRRHKLTSYPKGRLDIVQHARQAIGSSMNTKIGCVWYERTIDNDLNRCVMAALESLAKKYSRLGGQKGALSRLREINIAASYFRGVTTDPSLGFLQEPMIQSPKLIPDLRSYYREAINLSKAILQNQGISLSRAGSEFSLSSLIIDMGAVFEGYVRNVLVEKFSLNGYKVADGNLSHDAGGACRKLFTDDDKRERLGRNVNATPDIVLLKTNNDALRAEIVIDAKYKIAAPAAQRSEINQVATYALAYGVRKAVLVMPYHKDTKAGLHYLGEIGSVHFYQYNYDLAAQRVDVEEELWAAAMIQLCKPAA